VSAFAFVVFVVLSNKMDYYWCPHSLKEARKGFFVVTVLVKCGGRLQRRIFNGVGKLYVSLQLYCWAIL